MMTENLSSIHDPELRQALQKLFARQTFGIKLGLEPTRLLLNAFGNPHEHLQVIHVAGTNGKGSVCAMVASTLTEAGLRVGLYSSPHLVSFRERMKINGQTIPEEILALYAREMMPEIERTGCTFFEGTTVMALRYFAEQKVDVVVLETGMGGRLDSTNVVAPMVCAITSIGLDHTKHLGESYEEIAREKAGIMKPGAPVVIGRVRSRLRPLFLESAQAVGAQALFVDDYCRALLHQLSFDGTDASFIIGERELEHLKIDLIGSHQVENARVALLTLEQLAERYSLDESILRRGFASVRKNTGISGRFDRVAENPTVILDVAHNAEGATVLADTLKRIVGEEGQVRFVFGAVRDKDVEGVLQTIAPLTNHLYAVSADNPRSLPSDEIAWWSLHANISTTDAGSVESGISQAIAESEGEPVVVFGSFFVVGEGVTALEHYRENQKKKYDRVYDYDPITVSYLPDRERVEEKEYHTHTQNGTITMGTNSPESKGISTVQDKEFIQTSERTSQADQEAEVTTETNGKEGLQPLNGVQHLSMKERSPDDQPRERLIQQGPNALSVAELIAILLRTGTRNKDVLQLSQELLYAFGDSPTGDKFIDLVGRDLKELQRIPGIGPTKAVTLAAAFEIGKRVATRSFGKQPVIRGPQDVAAMFIPRMRALRKEQFHVIILNTANQVIRTDLVSEGTLNSSVVHPREVFRTAIIESAASIIGLHNHPSGNPQPSKEDIAITRQLVEAGRAVGIPFNDHIIIAGEKYVSLVNQGLL